MLKAAYAAAVRDALVGGGPDRDAARPLVAVLRGAYVRSLESWNGCRESCTLDSSLDTCVVKDGCETFAAEFEALVVAVVGGAAIPPVRLHWDPGAAGSRLAVVRDGAHRVAARLADRAGDVAAALGPPLADGALAWWRAQKWDAAFFRAAARGGAARADADAALAILRWVDGGGFSAGHVTVAVLWPAAYALPGALGAWRACVAAAGGEELLGRDVAWTPQGARVLAEHAYGDAPWLDYKVASCFPGPSRVARVSASRFPARAWADEAKAAFRAWYEARPAFAGDAKAAVHVADGVDDALGLAGLGLNAHSADLANVGAPAVARDLAARLAASLRGAAEGAAPPPVGAADAGGAARALGRVVVDSGAALAAWGLRPPPAPASEVDVVGDGALGAGGPTDAGAGPFAAPRSARLDDHGPDSGQEKRAKFPTSKAPLSAVFHSFWLIFGRAIISRNGLEAWMLFPERARAEHSR